MPKGRNRKTRKLKQYYGEDLANTLDEKRRKELGKKEGPKDV